MRFRSRQLQWPSGSTFVIQGTVAEDATAGTHVCTLTVTPGAGNEMTFQEGVIVSGATATAQTGDVYITDGTNRIGNILVGATLGNNTTWPLPQPFLNPAGGSPAVPAQGRVISGTMQLVLKVSTAAISVTQTFAVVLRVFGANPTAALADTVGTPTLTFNTNQFIG